MTTPKPDDRSTLVDPRVAAGWREASSEEPPASIDAAILAAARREVSAKPEPIDTRETRADRQRWWPLAAAATLAAVVVGLLQVTPVDKLGTSATDSGIVSDVPMPASPPVASTQAPISPSKEERFQRSDDARVTGEAPRTDAPQRTAPPVAQRLAPSAPPSAAAPTESRQLASAAPEPAATPDPFPAAKKTAADAAAAGGKVAAAPPPSAPALPSAPRSETAANVAREREATPRQDAPAASLAAPALSRAERASSAPAPIAKMAAEGAADSRVDGARAKDRSPLPVPDWIALIRRLRVEGKQTEAAKELAAFRAAHADHEKLLPPDLRDWHPAEK